MSRRAVWWLVGFSLLVWVGLGVAVAQGWLGPDVDRGAGFCESGNGWIRQPINTASNFGFTVAALAVAWRATQGSAMGRAVWGYVGLLALLGPASAAMHATESALGGHLDTLSMYLFAGFTAAYACTRWFGLSLASAAVLFVGFVVGCELIAWLIGPIPVLQHAGNTAFAVLLILTLSLEAQIARRDGHSTKWGVVALVVLLAAFAIWLPSRSGGSLCQPDSIVQGHGVWHLLGAVAAWCLYLYYDQRPTLPTTATSRGG